jgi:hypothetical protein
MDSSLAGKNNQPSVWPPAHLENLNNKPPEFQIQRGSMSQSDQLHPWHDCLEHSSRPRWCNRLDILLDAARA